MSLEVAFTREGSVADLIEHLLESTQSSIDAALYRFNNTRLASALAAAVRRGVRIRLVMDRDKYEETDTARQLMVQLGVPFRLSSGRQGRGSKMHHKFAILDSQIMLTGSYNWTVESEEQNYENLLILREARPVQSYTREFETLWFETDVMSSP
jgi:phosphatidylserine/phosphatidylglycerophosphate/cardiolipin synthase-like enzyme